jgi:perosamine synthetase
MDPNDIENRITERTKAIICFHWGGYPCDIDKIHAIAGRHNLTVIEDATDALGATYKSNPVGSLSKFTSFSFQATQKFTTCEGGMICMLDKDDCEAARRRRWFGIDREKRVPNMAGYYDFDVWETGYGYHMTNITATIGLAHLDDLPIILRRRNEIVVRYRESLKAVPGVTLFKSQPDRTSGNQLFTLHVEKRDDFCRMMHSKNVEVSMVHARNDQYSVFGGLRSDLPILDQFASSYISLPLHNRLSDEEVDYVIRCIADGW